MIRRIIVLFALLFLVFPTIVHSAEVLSIADFESSTFYKKYTVREKDVWTLRSGGKNFCYKYQDSENRYSGFGIELSSDPSNIKQIGIHWHGKSIYHPARLTKVREQFLRDLLLVVEPTVDPDTVIAYVKSQQVNSYPGGGNTMPLKQLGKAAIYAGTVGESLLVGIMIGSFSSDDSGNKSPDKNLLPQEVDSFYVGSDLMVWVGMSADDCFVILAPDDMVRQKIEKDPNDEDSYIVTKLYRKWGKEFEIQFTVAKRGGPYSINKIVILKE